MRTPCCPEKCAVGPTSRSITTTLEVQNFRSIITARPIRREWASLMSVALTDPTAFAQQDEIVELADPAAIADSPYYNPDFAPVPRTQRKWGIWDIAALWISMSACVTTYTLGAGYISRGM